MASPARDARRKARANDFRRLRQSVTASDLYRPTPASIAGCLEAAETSENYARSAGLARWELLRESPREPPPEELAEPAIAAHLVHAAESLAVAGHKLVRLPDMRRAFAGFRRAAGLMRQAAAIEVERRSERLARAGQYADLAAAVRQQAARRRLCRRRWGCTWLRRTTRWKITR